MGKILRRIGLYFYRHKIEDPQICNWCGEKVFLSANYCSGCGRKRAWAVNYTPPYPTLFEKIFYLVIWLLGISSIGYALWIATTESVNIRESILSGKYLVIFPLILLGSLFVVKANIFIEKIPSEREEL